MNSILDNNIPSDFHLINHRKKSNYLVSKCRFENQPLDQGHFYLKTIN